MSKGDLVAWEAGLTVLEALLEKARHNKAINFTTTNGLSIQASKHLDNFLWLVLNPSATANLSGRWANLATWSGQFPQETAACPTVPSLQCWAYLKTVSRQFWWQWRWQYLLFHLAQASLEPWFYVVLGFKPRASYMLASSGLNNTPSHLEACDNALKSSITDMKVSLDVSHLNESL